MKLNIKNPNTNEWHEIKPFNPNLCLIQELLQLCIEKNETTEHDVFFEFAGHINKISVSYYYGGFNKSQEITRSGFFISMDDEKELKKAINEIKELV